MGVEQINPVSRIAIALWLWHHEGGPGCQRAKDVIHRQIETQGRKGEDTIARPDVKPLVDIQHGVHSAAMINHDAFGSARRPRGIDDIGQIRRGG